MYLESLCIAGLFSRKCNWSYTLLFCQLMSSILITDFRKLGESEAQCNSLREEVKQLKAEIEQLKVGGKSASKT